MHNLLQFLLQSFEKKWLRISATAVKPLQFWAIVWVSASKYSRVVYCIQISSVRVQHSYLIAKGHPALQLVGCAKCPACCSGEAFQEAWHTRSEAALLQLSKEVSVTPRPRCQLASSAKDSQIEASEEVSLKLSPQISGLEDRQGKAR